ncbi:MAG: AmmeMemoRadiSam system protein B [archaeon]
MTRKPSVSGQFYPDAPEDLRKLIIACFFHPLGPGSLDGPPELHEHEGDPSDSPPDHGNLSAVIVPHAGISISGPCAAWSYRAIIEAGGFDTYVLLGPNHTGMGRTGISQEDFETPFGKAETDKTLCATLLKDGVILESDEAHMFEHSLEVQLPFLQVIHHDVLRTPFSIVPMVVSDLNDADRMADVLRQMITESDKRICLICSTDFTHHGHPYGYVPFTKDVQEKIKELDMGAIEHILKLDSKGFSGYVEKTGATICGRMPIALLLTTIADGRATLLKYFTSADIIGDRENSVSYASIAFYRG